MKAPRKQVKSWAVLLCGALGAAALNAIAADAPDESASGSPPDAGARQVDPAGWELRGGLLVELFTPERDTGDVNLELVLPRFLHSNSVPTELLPRWRIGATGNVDGRTSYAYTGPLWTIELLPRAFLDLYFGGLVHNGQLLRVDPRLSALGCRVLYQAGGNLGYRF